MRKTFIDNQNMAWDFSLQFKRGGTIRPFSWFGSVDTNTKNGIDFLVVFMKKRWWEEKQQFRENLEKTPNS